MNKILLSVTKGIEKDINEATRTKALKKNKESCAACGINISDYHHFHEENNKVTALCPLCYYPMHLDKIVAKNPGQIILLPEMSQIELNAMLRAMEYIKMQKENYVEVAEAIEIVDVLLKERADMADTYYSGGISNVNLLSQVLFAFTDEEYNKREIGLYGLRLMHNMDTFQREMKSWEPTLAKFKPEGWKSMIKKIAAGHNK